MNGDDEGDESEPAISLSKSNPLVAQMFSDCQPGDHIVVNLGYKGKVFPLQLVVGEDDEDEFTATMAEPGETDGESEGGESDTDQDADDGKATGGGVGAGTPLGATAALGAPPVNSAVDYIKSKRK